MIFCTSRLAPIMMRNIMNVRAEEYPTSHLTVPYSLM